MAVRGTQYVVSDDEDFDKASETSFLMGTTSETNTPAKISPKERRLILIILIGINLLNYLDRYTVSGILPQLKDKKTSGLDRDLSDSEGGLLMTMFVVSYMLTSPIFGYLGDRMNRKVLIAVGILLWGIFTVGGSFSQTYAQLLVARALVGVGEASYATIAPTIIADLYPPETRTQKLSFFYVAIPVGAYYGAQVAESLGSWRWALRVSPPIGLFLTIIMFVFTRDPPRGESEGHAHSLAINSSSGFGAFFADCKKVLKVPTFFWSVAGFTAVTFTSGAFAQWAPTYVYRQTQLGQNPLSSTTASLIFGGITVVSGVSGTLMGSYISKRLETVTPAHDSYVCGLGLLSSVVMMGIAVPVAAYNIWAFWFLVLIGEIFLCLNWGPVAAITLYVVRPATRNTAEALSILLTHLLGDAMSPYLVGLVSDQLSKRYNIESADALMMALFLPVFVSLLGSFAFIRSAKFVAQDRAIASTSEPITTFKLINEELT